MISGSEPHGTSRERSNFVARFESSIDVLWADCELLDPKVLRMVEDQICDAPSADLIKQPPMWELSIAQRDTIVWTVSTLKK